MRSKDEREVALKRDGYTCQICGRGIRDGWDVEVHHHKKMGMGGRKLNDTADNMITLCQECHRQIERGKWKIIKLQPLEVVSVYGEVLQDLHRNLQVGPAGIEPATSGL